MIVRCLQAHRLLHPPRQTSLLPRCHPRRRKSADSYTAQHRIRQTVPPLFRLPASDASEIGQMSGAIIDSMKTKIQEALNAEKVEIVDVEGDARHVTINVVASAFEGKSSVDRQRMVYKAIWLELQDAVHAVDTMTTSTPNEATT